MRHLLLLALTGALLGPPPAFAARAEGSEVSALTAPSFVVRGAPRGAGALPAAAHRALPLGPNAEPLRSAGGPNHALLRAALATGLAAGGAYGAAVVSHGQWEDATSDADNLDTLRARTNGFVFTSGALGLGAVSLGVASFTVGR